MAASTVRLAWRQLGNILAISRGALDSTPRCCIHCSNISLKENYSKPEEPITGSADVMQSSVKAKKISRAMQSYLEQAVEYEKQKKSLTIEYELGRRHLANMMGIDPDFFTKEHVNLAIKYLMPSGLFDQKARPHMLEASEVLPHKKSAQFGQDGRPFHHLFYTGKANYYHTMYTLVQTIEKLNAMVDSQEMPVEFRIPEYRLNTTEWIGLPALQLLTRESVTEHDHSRFVRLVDKLAQHPLSGREEELIMGYRKPMVVITSIEHSSPLVDDDGRLYYFGKGKRKACHASVRVYLNGTGKFEVNGKDILHFKDISHREQIMAPLLVCNLLGKVDVIAEVNSEGPSAQSGAIRYSLARALAAYVDERTKSRLIVAGLLTQDPRRREKKKAGQEGARKKYTWRRR